MQKEGFMLSKKERFMLSKKSVSGTSDAEKIIDGVTDSGKIFKTMT